MADGYRSRYYNFDPGQYFAQTMAEGPSYNPYSPSPDIFGGIRKTINSIWAFREFQRQQQEERRQQEFEERLAERRMGLQEKQFAADVEEAKAAREERRKANWMENYQRIFGDTARSKVTLTPGGEEMAKAYGYDPTSLTPEDTLRMNALDIEQTSDIAEKQRKEAKDTQTARRAQGVSFVSYHLADVTEKIKKLMGKEVDEWVPNPRFDKNDSKRMKKSGIPREIPNPDKKELPFQLAALQKVKDYLEGMSARVGQGYELTPEDQENILSMAGDSRYREQYNKELGEDVILGSLDLGLSAREVNRFYYDWRKAGGKGNFLEMLYQYFQEEGR